MILSETNTVCQIRANSGICKTKKKKKEKIILSWRDIFPNLFVYRKTRTFETTVGAVHCKVLPVTVYGVYRIFTWSQNGTSGSADRKYQNNNACVGTRSPALT